MLKKLLVVGLVLLLWVEHKPDVNYEGYLEGNGANASHQLQPFTPIIDMLECLQEIL